VHFEEHRLRGSRENSKVLIPRSLRPAASSFAIVSAVWRHVATLLHGSLTIGGKENRSGARRLWKGAQVNGRASGVNLTAPSVGTVPGW